MIMEGGKSQDLQGEVQRSWDGKGSKELSNGEHGSWDKAGDELGRCPVTGKWVAILVWGGLELWEIELEEDSIGKFRTGRPQVLICRKSAEWNVAFADERGS